MKLQQLRYVVEIVRHNNHLSAAADALNTSQPGVSRQIQLLEQELGFEIFMRTRNRIIDLTEPGRVVFSIAQRIATDVAALKSLKEDMHSGNRGVFTIATTHTQARYVLPKVVEKFVARYPDVKLVLKQGDPEEICALVEAGDADLSIGTETTRDFPNLVKLDCFDLHRCIVAPVGHPILAVPELTLEEIARYPIITYDTRYSGRWKVMKAFSDAGLEPKIVMSGIDADVCKTYVGMGLGIGILASMTYDPERDVGIRARDASHLLPSSTIKIVLRRNTYLRSFLLDFVHSVAPNLTPLRVRRAVHEFQTVAG
ncbi:MULTISPECIES: LysR substrate-binding domain-containing protein [Sphingobium]|jgi:LysR family cys regulon transcriptional activator|uniref:Cys regulon transcriptional activator CysB n=2 Tax=Sphingobium fuliginis (strain ATCC 27551) TaxID=336203 RepID=A0A292ZNN9_SPHSA|nr:MULTISPECIES: LysR substrate-binding domain-containing protein [Sphingobium]OAP30749.1 transcriptional regulator CysB [Sphingobium sp. 20006FA]AJR23241.1 CysB family transcriptional regulator [Sphingobium sp. YBL2]KXU33335.1 transcriptional regulator CysB [Sphingobium sp. AM]KYC31505.1 transcriptional regulator CysB [Sphingobium sp. 22B]PNQ04289.1 transcriptional regulator CysB [Sphingobium sp. SA916]